MSRIGDPEKHFVGAEIYYIVTVSGSGVGVDRSTESAAHIADLFLYCTFKRGVLSFGITPKVHPATVFVG